MNVLSLPAVTQFLGEIQALQLRARSLRDIEHGLAAMPELLHAVSSALSETPDTMLEGQVPAVHRFQFITKLRVFYSSKQEWLDPYCWESAVETTIHYQTSESINIRRILASLPEVGLYIDPARVVDTPHIVNGRTVTLSPAKWPIAASALIFVMYRGGEYDHPSLDMLLNDIYPHTSKATLKTLLDADLVSDEAALCDFLVSNELRSRKPDVPVLLAHDLTGI